MVKIGIIGGSGFYALDRLQNVEELTIATPFGAPSAPIVHGRIVSDSHARDRPDRRRFILFLFFVFFLDSATLTWQRSAG